MIFRFKFYLNCSPCLRYWIIDSRKFNVILVMVFIVLQIVDSSRVEVREHPLPNGHEPASVGSHPPEELGLEVDLGYDAPGHAEHGGELPVPGLTLHNVVMVGLLSR